MHSSPKEKVSIRSLFRHSGPQVSTADASIFMVSTPPQRRPKRMTVRLYHNPALVSNFSTLQYAHSSRTEFSSIGSVQYSVLRPVYIIRCSTRGRGLAEPSYPGPPKEMLLHMTQVGQMMTVAQLTSEFAKMPSILMGCERDKCPSRPSRAHKPLPKQRE